MAPTIYDSLVAVVLEARRSGRPGLDLSPHQLSRSSALDLQLAVLDRFLNDGDALAGWKVEFTAGAARDRLGAGYRPFGFILQSHTFASGAHIPWASVSTGSTVRLDAEICLVVARDVDHAMDRDQARRSVGEVMASFEITQRRRAPDCDDATVLADGCANWGIVTGATGRPPSEDLGGTAVLLLCDGAVVAVRDGAHVVDDPFASLAALSATLAEHGQGLRAGQKVITGAFVTSEVGPGTWEGRFAGLGEVRLTFD